MKLSEKFDQTIKALKFNLLKTYSHISLTDLDSPVATTKSTGLSCCNIKCIAFTDKMCHNFVLAGRRHYILYKLINISSTAILPFYNYLIKAAWVI